MTIPSSLLGSLAHVSHLTLRTDRFAFTYTAWSTEGGIRCPAIVRHPSIPGEKRGGVEHAFTTVMDILPTVASPDLHDCPPDGSDQLMCCLRCLVHPETAGPGWGFASREDVPRPYRPATQGEELDALVI
jgi:hypothetical protein